MKKCPRIVQIVGFLFLFGMLVAPIVPAFAQEAETVADVAPYEQRAARSEFVPLAAIPGVTSNPEDRTLAEYINALFRITIGIAALIAVIKITFAGIKYMATDAFSTKESAKSDITSALFGLLIILSTFVILNLVYPNILNLNVFQDLAPVQVTNMIPPVGIGTNYVYRGTTARTQEQIVQEFVDYSQECRESGGNPELGGPDLLERAQYGLETLLNVTQINPIGPRPSWFLGDPSRLQEVNFICSPRPGTAIDEDPTIPEGYVEQNFVIREGEQQYGEARVYEDYPPGIRRSQREEFINNCRQQIAQEGGVPLDDVPEALDPLPGGIQTEGSARVAVLDDGTDRLVYYCVGPDTAP